jgi:hypothetical protein
MRDGPTILAMVLCDQTHPGRCRSEDARPLYTAADANHADRSTTPIIDKFSEVCNVITVTYDTEWAYRGHSVTPSWQSS